MWWFKKKEVPKKEVPKKEFNLYQLEGRIPSEGNVRYWGLVELLIDKEYITYEEG